MSKSLVLIIEDDADFRQVLTDAVAVNYDVIQACNGFEAIELLKAGELQPALVLCDIRMPVMGGIEFIKQTVVKNLDLSVCLITGSDDKADLMVALRIGVLDFIEKPVSLETLKQKISLLVEIGKRKIQIKHNLKNNTAVNNSIKLNNLLKIRNGLIYE